MIKREKKRYYYISIFTLTKVLTHFLFKYLVSIFLYCLSYIAVINSANKLIINI